MEGWRNRGKEGGRLLGGGGNELAKGGGKRCKNLLMGKCVLHSAQAAASTTYGAE